MKLKGNAAGIAEAVLALLLTVGSLTVFRACDSAEGRYMACHWAQNAVTLAGTVLTVQSLLRIVIRNKGVGTGLSLGIFTLAASLTILPKTVISLCMMETMRCHTVFRPAVIVISVLLAAVSGIDAATGLIRTGKDK